MSTNFSAGLPQLVEHAESIARLEKYQSSCYRIYDPTYYVFGAQAALQPSGVQAWESLSFDYTARVSSMQVSTTRDYRGPVS